MEQRMGSHKLYKGRYIINFYDRTDEWLRYSFDNTRQILAFMKKPITRHNVTLINTIIARALRTEKHYVKFLGKETLCVHIIDIMSPDDEDDENKGE